MRAFPWVAVAGRGRERPPGARVPLFVAPLGLMAGRTPPLYIGKEAGLPVSSITRPPCRIQCPGLGHLMEVDIFYDGQSFQICELLHVAQVSRQIELQWRFGRAFRDALLTAYTRQSSGCPNIEESRKGWWPTPSPLWNDFSQTTPVGLEPAARLREPTWPSILGFRV